MAFFTRQQFIHVFPAQDGAFVALVDEKNKTCEKFEGCYCKGAFARRQQVFGDTIEVELTEGRYAVCYTDKSDPREDHDFTLQSNLGEFQHPSRLSGGEGGRELQ